MTTIIRFDNSCRLTEEDDLELWKALDKELSFMIQGAEFSAAFQGYFNDAGEFVTWDGKRHLLTESGKFPVGLLPRVEEFLTLRGRQYTIIDKRSEKVSGNVIDISSNLTAIGKEPRPYQIRACDAATEHDRGVIRIATGGGKCSHKDSLIITDQGLLTYEELLDDVKLNKQEAYQQEITVGTSEKFGSVDKTSMIYRDGYGPSRRITTFYGFENTATPEHKIQVMDKCGEVVWKKYKNIEIGDYVAISYGNKIFGSQDMDLDEAYWYGLLLGDGSLTLKNRTELINKDKHILDFVNKFCIANNLPLSIRKRKGTDACYLRIFSKQYRDSLFSMGFCYTNAQEKVIPKKLRMLKKEPLAMVLRGLFETDGWVDSSSIGIGLTSFEMITQIHLTLLNYGIVSNVSKKVDNRKSTYLDYFVLRIPTEFVDLFNNSIGFDPNGYKFHIASNIKSIGVSKKNIVPNQCDNINSVLNKGSSIFGSVSKFLETCPIPMATIFRWRTGKSKPPHKRLVDFFQWCHSVGVNYDYSHLIGVFFDKIKSIEDTKSDNYDFVVPKTHSFISQGFVNHNTMVSALVVSKIGKSALILVIGKDLLYQTQSFFEKVFGQEIGIIGDGKCNIKDINVATIWSVGQALGIKKSATLDDSNEKEKKIDPGKFSKIKEVLLNSSTVILDECHLAACDTVQTISRNIKAEYVYGMSASPWRDDGADLLIEAFLGRKVIDISARELINSGYLVEPTIRFLTPQQYKYKSGKYPKIYSNYIVENEQRNGMIVKGTTRLVEQGFVPLVLFHTIKHGDVLFEELKKNVPVALLSGKDNSKIRERIKGDLEDGKVKCIIASKIFDIGIDLPILSGLVIAGAGKSSVRALQRIGRVIRPYQGKTMAAIIDFQDQAPYLNNHALIRRKIYESEFNVQWPEKK